jgi:hypothetical protein
MLLMGLLALARAATVAGDTHGGATCNATMLFGTTIGTGNLSSHHAGAGGSDASCCAACLAEPACLAFVVDKHTCFLKANLDGRRPKSGNMAGIVRGSLPPTPAPKPAPRPPPAPPQPTAGLAWADSFGSHMVIQQLPALTVLWGFASPGAIVSAQRLLGSAGTPASANSSNTTGVDGVWWLTLPGRPAGNETFAFHASVRGSSAAAIEMEDVVYGDVWVCSGQSNMAVVVGQVFNASDVLREAEAYATEPTNPLRLFAANMSCGHGKVCHFKQDQNHLSPCTRPPCFTTGPNAGWTPTSAAVLSSDGKGNPLPVWSGSFSAVCYLFGRRVQATRQYPVGLISSYIGGTPDECWSSKEASAACPATPTSNAHMDYGDCWYSMITPLLRTPIFGAIFYQGETDTDVGGASKVDAARAVGYNCTFHAMLNDWRAKFHQVRYTFCYWAYFPLPILCARAAFGRMCPRIRLLCCCLHRPVVGSRSWTSRLASFSSLHGAWAQGRTPTTAAGRALTARSHRSAGPRSSSTAAPRTPSSPSRQTLPISTHPTDRFIPATKSLSVTGWHWGRGESPTRSQACTRPVRAGQWPRRLLWARGACMCNFQAVRRVESSCVRRLGSR